MNLFTLLDAWRPAFRDQVLPWRTRCCRRPAFRPRLELLESRSLPSTSPLTSLADPGFETPVLGNGVFQYNPVNSPWIYTGSAGLSGNESAVTGGNPNAPEGNQVAFLQAVGSINQNVTFPAGVFAISFSAAQRANVQANSQTFEVLIDDNVVGTFNNLVGTSYTTLTTANFTVTAGSHLLTFQGTDLNGGDNTALLDQVAITSSDFQTPAVSDFAFQYNPTGGAWVYSGTAGLAGNGSAFTNDNPNAPVGNQVAFVQQQGGISESLVFPAGTYDLSFSAAQRGSFQASGQTFQVLVDGTVVGTFNDLTNTNYTTLTTSSFSVVTGSHSIVFQGTNLNGGDNTVLIDGLAFNPLLTSLEDSGFEQPALANGTYEYGPANSPWHFNGAGVAANGSAFTINNPDAPQGNQVAFIQSGGSMSQSAMFPLGTFEISFSAAQRGSSQASFEPFGISVDTTVVYSSYDDDGDNLVVGTSYETYTTDPFTVTPGLHRIVFQGFSDADNTILLDQITIIQVTTSPTDPGFETPAVGTGAFQYDPSGSGWTFTGTAGLAGNVSGFTVDNANAPQGNQVAFVQYTGSISQAVTFPLGTNASSDPAFEYNSTYDISFSAAQRGGDYQASSQTFQVLVDGTVVGTFNNLSGTNYSTLTTANFTTDYGSHTITFQGTDLNGGDNTVLIDQVSINPLPIGPSDPAFQVPLVGTFGYEYQPASSPWTFSSSAGLTGTDSLFTNGNGAPPGDAQVAFLQAVSSMSQNVTFAAGTYTLSFFATQRLNYQASLQTFEILLDGNVIGTFNNVPASYYFQQFASPSFAVTAGVHNLVFQATDLYGGDNTIFLAALVVNPIIVGPSDPDFALPTLGYGASQSNPAASPWTFSGSAGVASNYSAYTSANPLAPAGNQVAYLQGTASISQNMAFPFGTYEISFSAAQRANDQNSTETFEVLVDGNVVGTFNNLMNTTYTPLTTPSFVVGTGSHTITFLGTNQNGGNNTVLLDEVAIKPLPPLDGSFEVPAQVSSTDLYQYNPTGSPWIFTASAGLAGNGSAFTSGNPNAPDGSQVAFMQALGSISQSVTLQAGTYDISFSVAQRGNVPGNAQTFQVLVDGGVVGIFDNLVGTSYTTLTTSSFTVTAGSHSLTFGGTDLNGGDNTVLLDQVTINGG